MTRGRNPDNMMFAARPKTRGLFPRTRRQNVGYRGLPSSRIPKIRSTCSSVSQIIGSEGGSIKLPDVDVALKVPKDALSSGEEVKISVTLDLGEEHPLLQDDQLVLGPVISCKPDGQKFLKPVSISLLHSGANISVNCLQVWCKEETMIESPWRKIYDRTQEGDQSEVAVKVEGHQIKFRVNHFTLYDIVTAPISLLKNFFQGPELELDILAYMYPVEVATCRNVLLRVYAVKTNDQASRKLIEDTEKDARESGMCSIPSGFNLMPTGKGLTIQVRNVDPEDEWLPVDTMEGTISYKSLQRGGLVSRCEIKFQQHLVRIQANSFEGSFDIRQEGNNEVVPGINFDDKMAVRNRDKGRQDGQQLLPEEHAACNRMDGAGDHFVLAREQPLRPHHQPDKAGRHMLIMLDRFAEEQLLQQKDQARQRPSQHCWKSNNSSSANNSASLCAAQGAQGSALNSCSDVNSIIPHLESCSLTYTETNGACASVKKELGDCGPYLKSVARNIQPRWLEVAKTLGFTAEDCQAFLQRKSFIKEPWWPAYMMLDRWKSNLQLSDFDQIQEILRDAVRPCEHYRTPANHNSIR